MKPLARMCLLGVLAFWLTAGQAEPPPGDPDPLIAQALAAGWVQTDPLIRARLVDNLRFAGVEGDEEALFTHALSLGMASSDPVVRRRLRARALAVVDERLAPPTEAQLQAFLEAHPERYRPALRIVADHAFDGAAGTLPAELTGSIERWARRLGPDFAEGLATAPLEEWVVLSSRHGEHRVRVRHREQPPLPALEALRARLEADWRSARRPAHRAQELARLEGA